MEFTITFIRKLFWGLLLFSPLLLFLCLAIIVLGQLTGRLEGWSRFDALYWSFITALTVGYGDIRPSRRGGRIISIFITLVGIIMSGIIVTISVNAGLKAFERHVDKQVIMEINERLK